MPQIGNAATRWKHGTVIPRLQNPGTGEPLVTSLEDQCFSEKLPSELLKVFLSQNHTLPQSEEGIYWSKKPF